MKLKRSRVFFWIFCISAVAYMLSCIILFLGKLFLKWPVDTMTIILFFAIWLPIILPLLGKLNIGRLKYKDWEIEFMRKSVEQFQSEYAERSNETEIGKDQKSFKEQGIEFNPYDIRLKYTSNRADDEFFNVTVRLDAPEGFMPQVEKVTYKMHPAFERPLVDTTIPPFENKFRCWGEFTIFAVIKLKNGEQLRRQRFLALEDSQEEE